LIELLEQGRAEVRNQYTRSVRREGNPEAQRVMREVFEVADMSWRGIGRIPESGLRLRKEFQEFDAEQRFQVTAIQTEESEVCIAGAVLQGKKKPTDCPAFGKACTPEHPLGAPMVSAEGACAAYYTYRRYQEATDAV